MAGFDGHLTGASRPSESGFEHCYSRPESDKTVGYAQRYDIGCMNELTETRD